MLTAFSRILLILTVFVAGILVGNIFMPQRNLDAEDIVSLQAPQTSLNLDKEPSVQDALSALSDQSNALAKAQSAPQENAALWQDTIRKTLVLQAYASAKADYELALLKIQNSPEEKDFFIQARNNYEKISDLITTLFPSIKNDIQIINAAPKTPEELMTSASTVTGAAQAVSTDTVLSAPAISTFTAASSAAATASAAAAQISTAAAISNRTAVSSAALSAQVTAPEVKTRTITK